MEGISAFLLALGGARAWLTLLFAAPAIPTTVDLGLPLGLHQMFDVMFCIFMVAVALNSQKIAPLCRAPWVRPVILGGMLGASVLCCGASVLGPSASGLAVAGALVGGLGIAAFLLTWAEVMSGLSLARIALFSALSQLFAVVLVYFCTGLEGHRLLAALVLLPLVALSAMDHALKQVDRNDAPPASSKLDLAKSVPWKLIAFMGVFSFAYGLRGSQLSMGAGMHSGLSTGICMAVFAALVYFFSDRISMKALIRSTPLLMLCGFLLIPAEGLLGSVVSGYLISIGYSLISLMVSLMLYDISKRFCIAVIALMGLKHAMQIFLVAGNLVDGALDLAGISPALQNTLITAGVVVLVFAALFILLTEKDMTSSWGVRFMDAQSLTEDGLERKRLIERCDQLSKECKLSPREDEILRLYAQGKNGPAIEKELFIAEGTLKTHTRHIYEKLGITSRKELYKTLGIDA